MEETQRTRRERLAKEQKRAKKAKLMMTAKKPTVDLQLIRSEQPTESLTTFSNPFRAIPSSLEAAGSSKALLKESILSGGTLDSSKEAAQDFR